MGRPTPGRARLKWALVAAGAAVLLAAVAVAVATRLVNTPAFQGYVAQAASRALGRPVSFASLSIDVFPVPAVVLRQLAVAEDPAFGPAAFLTVDEGSMRLRLRPLFAGRVELADLTLTSPKIELIENDAGRWNWASLGVGVPAPTAPPKGGTRAPGQAAASALLTRVRVIDGTMFYRKLGSAAGPGVRAEKINLTLTHGLGAATATGDAVVQPGDVKLTLAEATLTRSGASTIAEMPLRATVLVDARDVGPLGALVMAGPAMAGPARGQLAVSGTPARMVANGAMAFDRLTLSEDHPGCQPRRRSLVVSDVRIPVAYAGTHLDSAPLDAKLSHGSISGRLAVDFTPDRIGTLRDIKVTGVELGPILMDFLCHPFAVVGPLDLTGEATGRGADPLRTLSGSGRFKIGPGTVVGSEVARLLAQALKVTGAISAVVSPEHRVTTPLAFDSITGSYTIADGVARTRDLVYQSAEVRVTAAGTYALRNGHIDMQVVLTQGSNEIKGVVTGTAGSLHVTPAGVKIHDVRGIKRFVETLFR